MRLLIILVAALILLDPFGALAEPAPQIHVTVGTVGTPTGNEAHINIGILDAKRSAVILSGTGWELIQTTPDMTCTLNVCIIDATASASYPVITLRATIPVDLTIHAESTGGVDDETVTLDGTAPPPIIAPTPEFDLGTNPIILPFVFKNASVR